MNKLHHEYSVLLSVVFFLVSAVSCGDRENMARLDEADRLLDQYPDSALVIVRSIDTLSLHNPEERGRHSLLLTMALLKTDPSAVSDAIFKPAWKHYGPINEPSRETVLAHFARAALWELQDSLTHAVLEYEKVIGTSDVRGFKLYKGLACMNEASVYSDEMYFDKARAFIERSKGYLQNSIYDNALGYALLSSGMLYDIKNDYAKADKEFKSAFELAERTSDTQLKKEIEGAVAYALSCRNDYAGAVEKYTAIINDSISSFTTKDVFAYARALCSSGNPDEALALSLKSKPDGDNYLKADYFYTCSTIYDALGDHEMSNAMLDSFTRYENICLNTVLGSGVNTRLQEIHNKSFGDALTSYGEETAYFIAIIGSISIIILTVMLISIMRRQLISYIRRRERNRSEKHHSLRFANISGKLDLERREKSDLNLAFDCARREVKTLKDVIDDWESGKSMDQLKFDTWIRPHRNIALICNDCKDVGKYGGLEAYHTLRSGYIEKYKDRQFLATLMDDIDHLTGHLLSRLRTDAEMKEQDLTLLSYDICGFNYRSIAVLMDITESNCSSMKTRCKRSLTVFLSDQVYRYVDFIPMLKKMKQSDINIED